MIYKGTKVNDYPNVSKHIHKKNSFFLVFLVYSDLQSIIYSDLVYSDLQPEYLEYQDL